MFQAYDASPDDETDKLSCSLHDYLSELTQEEYSNPPSGLMYQMSMANRYILGQEISGSDHQSELRWEVVKENAKGRDNVKIYALNR